MNIVTWSNHSFNYERMKRMENAMQIFENDEFGKVRTVAVEDEPWFVGKDVTDILGYQNASKALADHVDDDDKLNNESLSSLGQRGGWLINESGLYSLVLSSKLPTAKKFKRWVTSEVLPAIRKHGGYLTPEKVEEVLLNPDTIITLATNLKAEQEKRKAAELQIEADRPKVVFADSVSVSHTNILISELAKVLKQNGVPNMGQNRLFQWLRDNNYLISRRGTDYNMPMQKSMEMGLFCIKETTVNHSDGHTSISRTPKVTGKGQIYFVNKFLNSTKALAEDGVAK